MVRERGKDGEVEGGREGGRERLREGTPSSHSMNGLLDHPALHAKRTHSNCCMYSLSLPPLLPGTSPAPLSSPTHPPGVTGHPIPILLYLPFLLPPPTHCIVCPIFRYSTPGAHIAMAACRLSSVTWADKVGGGGQKGRRKSNGSVHMEK